jgi:proline iminopeptidase
VSFFQGVTCDFQPEPAACNPQLATCKGLNLHKNLKKSVLSRGLIPHGESLARREQVNFAVHFKTSNVMTTRNLFTMALGAVLFVSCAKERFINEPGNLVPKTVTEDTLLPSIKVNGAWLHSEAFGHPDSTMVVFLHGGPGGDYRSLLNGKQLANHGYRVVFYDQRGSGLSQRFPKASYTSLGLGVLDQMYDDLAGVIAHYRKSAAQKVYLVGHSWGGILATGFAAKYPFKVQGLVVAEPGGLKWEDIEEYTKKSRDFGLWTELANDAAFLDQFLSGKKDQHAVLDYKMALMGYNNNITGEHNVLPGSQWRAGAVVNTACYEIADEYAPDFTVGINAFTKPVLFLYSAQNKAYTDAWAQKISSAYNTKVLQKITGTGHQGMFQDNTAWSGSTLPTIVAYFRSL